MALIQASAGHGPIHTDPTFWVAICVLIFLGFLLYKGVHKVLGKSLDERSVKISEELAEARRLLALLLRMRRLRALQAAQAAVPRLSEPGWTLHAYG